MLGVQCGLPLRQRKIKENYAWKLSQKKIVFSLMRTTAPVGRVFKFHYSFVILRLICICIYLIKMCPGWAGRKITTSWLLVSHWFNPLSLPLCIESWTVFPWKPLTPCWAPGGCAHHWAHLQPTGEANSSEDRNSLVTQLFSVLVTVIIRLFF